MPQGQIIRTARALLTLANETLEGGDAAPTAADAILVENLQFVPEQSNAQTNETTGSLDPAAPIPGGIKGNLSFDVILRGSGAAATAPKWGRILKACAWEEVVTSAAVPTSPQLAAAGSSTGLTLGAAASATAQAYRGMPIHLYRNSGNPLFDFVSNYTSGKVATLCETYSPALGATVEYQIRPNVLYRPTSDDSLIHSLTAYAYFDGLVYKAIGWRGTFTLTMIAGAIARFRFEGGGMFAGRDDLAVPASPTFDSSVPPVWRDPDDDGAGHCSIERAEVAVQQLQLMNGVQRAYPDNPNQAEGFDVSKITARRMTGTINPLASLVATRDALADMRAGTPRLVHARIGQSAGNRFGLVVPAAVYENFGHGNREGLMTDELPFFCSGPDAGGFLCQW